MKRRYPKSLLTRSSRSPERPNRGSGFALVVALSLMAFVLVLLLSLVAFVRVESSVSAQNQSLTEARANAVLAMQIALGELQKHAGADRRVTAPATVGYPAKETLYGFLRTHAADVNGFKTALSQSGRQDFDTDIVDWWEDRNPRWTGIWNSTLENGRPDRDQLPLWIVSGNEQFALAPDATSYPPGYLTPDLNLESEFAGREDQLVWLVRGGSAARSAAAAGAGDLIASDRMEGHVRVPKQAIVGEDGAAVGHYAYWVADESQKANIAVRDPWFDETNLDSESYRNRLQSPLRAGWENIESFRPVFERNSLSPNDSNLEKLGSADQVRLLDTDLTEAGRIHYHDITTTSETLFADAARGGLRKNLTAFLERGQGLQPSDPIPDPDDYSGDDRFGADNAGFPFSDTNIPTWEQIREWYDNEAEETSDGGSVRVDENIGPILTAFRMHVGFSRQNDKVQMHLFPVITLWNPYDAKLDSQSYTLRYEFPIEFEELSFPTDHPGPDQRFVKTSRLGQGIFSERQRGFRVLENKGLELRFTTGFEAGQLKVLSILSEQPLGDIGGSPIVQMDLQEGFDSDGPLSAYFSVLDLDPADTASFPNARYFAVIDSLPSSIEEFRFTGGAFEAVYTKYGRINGGAVSDVVTIDRRSAANRPPDLAFNRGRTLHAHPGIDFTSNILGNGNIYDHDYPIFPVADTSFRPLNKTNYSDLASVKTISNRIRLFSTFNPGALNFGVHPRIEATRGPFPQNNIDDYETINFASDNIIANSSSASARANNTWDRNMADSPAGPGGPTYGFGLIINHFTDKDILGLNTIPLKLVKRPTFNLLSLGGLQQVNLAPFFWQPGFTVGNSEASPYVDREAIAGITSREVGVGRLSSARYQEIPNDSENQNIDLSYLLNDALWDRYFLAGIQNDSEAQDVLDGEPAPNSRIVPRSELADPSALTDFDEAARALSFRGGLNVNSTSKAAWKALLTSFRDLQIEKAAGGDANPEESVPISRTLLPLQEVIDFTFDLNADGTDTDPSATIDPSDFGAGATTPRDLGILLGGFRYLNDDMIDVLSERIVDEVRLRGPFLSVSDFVNRRLVAPDRSSGTWESLRKQAETQSGRYTGAGFLKAENYDPLVGLEGLNGPLQRAINLSGINGGLNHPADPAASGLYHRDLGYGVFDGAQMWQSQWFASNDLKFSFFASTGHYLDTEHLAGVPAGESGQLMAHAPGFVTQGDLLSMIGSALTARGDTFLIRSYGDKVDPATGEASNRVWLETIVQRVPEPVTDADGDYEPDDEFGRQFVIKSMRWIGESDI